MSGWVDEASGNELVNGWEGSWWVGGRSNEWVGGGLVGGELVSVWERELVRVS